MEMELDQEDVITKFQQDTDLDAIIYGITIACTSKLPAFRNVSCKDHVSSNDQLTTSDGEVVCIICLKDSFKNILIPHLLPQLTSLQNKNTKPVEQESLGIRLTKEYTDLKLKVAELCTKFGQFHQESEWDNPEEVRQTLKEPYFDGMQAFVEVSRAIAEYAPEFNGVVKETCQSMFNMMSSYEKYLQPSFLSINNEIKNEFLDIAQQL